TVSGAWILPGVHLLELQYPFVCGGHYRAFVIIGAQDVDRLCDHGQIGVGDAGHVRTVPGNHVRWVTSTSNRIDEPTVEVAVEALSSGTIGVSVRRGIGG